MARHRLPATLFGVLSAALVVGCAGILGIASEVDRAEPVADGGGGGGGGGEDVAAAEASGPDHDATTDQASDAPDTLPPSCDITKEFGIPVPIDSVNTPVDDGAARLSEDELTIYVDGPHTPGDTSYNISFAKRGTLGGAFGPLQSFPSVDNSIDTSDDEYAPNVTSDGLNLVFERKTLATSDSNLYIATRTKITDKFGTVYSIANLNTSDYEANVFLRDTLDELWHVRQKVGHSGDTDISLATNMPGVGYVIDPADGQLANVNTTYYDASPVISQNGLALYLSSDRPTGLVASGLGGTNIWVATRSATKTKFNVPVLVANVNSDANEYPGFISADGCRLYLASTRTGATARGGQDIYVATRPF